jgi:hypothetical protein
VEKLWDGCGIKCQLLLFELKNNIKYAQALSLWARLAYVTRIELTFSVAQFVGTNFGTEVSRFFLSCRVLN